MSMNRRHNFQTISWFYDLWKRELLDLDPPYQRRSVWNQNFKDYFIDTVLQNYPAPAIFLYEDINSDGSSRYHVVDGKQRLTTLFDFIQGKFPAGEKIALTQVQGKYFANLDDATKKKFWGYQFLVEYVPTEEESIINGIFDRINRNTAKLTAQELRHAKLDGEFIRTAEDLSIWMAGELPDNFPRFASQSKKQMKDVEFVALLLLFLEDGPKGYSQDDLDKAFTDRDIDWEQKTHIESEFRSTIMSLKHIIKASDDGDIIVGSRLRNQADFYSLFGAIVELKRSNTLAVSAEAAQRLKCFALRVENEGERANDQKLKDYYEAARSASNDKGPRETRINYVKGLLAA